MASLKEIRKEKNLTQQELADISGISIRTIQRLEKGLTDGSPHTLKTLAKALQVDNLIATEAKQSNSRNSEDKLNPIRMMNFSILSVLLIPLGNLIFPFILLLIHRKNPTVKELGRRIVGFQFIQSFFLIFIMGVLFTMMGRAGGAIPIPVIICYWLTVIFNLIVVILTSRKLQKKKTIPSFFPKFF